MVCEYRFLSLSTLTRLISPGKDHPMFRRLARINAFSFFWRRNERNTSDRCLGLVLDLFFGLGCAIPMSKEKAALLDLLGELFPAIDADRMIDSKLQRF